MRDECHWDFHNAMRVCNVSNTFHFCNRQHWRRCVRGLCNLIFRPGRKLRTCSKSLQAISMTCVIAKMESSTKCITKERRKRKQSPGHALKASLRQAAAQKRLTVGLRNGVNRLKRDPESVMVCLLLQGFTAAGKVKDEVGCNIQHTLLQAFCAESRISIVRVLASADLMRLVGQLAGKMEIKASDGCCQEASPTDCSLLVIEHPEGSPSVEDLTWAAACEGGHLHIQASCHLPSD